MKIDKIMNLIGPLINEKFAFRALVKKQAKKDNKKISDPVIDETFLLWKIEQLKIAVEALKKEMDGKNKPTIIKP